VDFSDVYFNPNNGGAPDPSYTLAHVALNGSGYATYTTYNGSATTIMAGEEALRSCRRCDLLDASAPAQTSMSAVFPSRMRVRCCTVVRS
jgi:hypothetical protein